jgi:hypothetical protein
MMHRSRRFVVVDVYTAEALAEKLTEYTWCACNGFRLGEYLFLNDSTGPDGAQEYAIVKGSKQLESITFGWCDRAKGLKYVQRVISGEFDAAEYATVTNPIETPADHGSCAHCA